MKKVFGSLLTAAVTVSSLAPCVMANDVKVSIDGKYLTFDVPPQIINDSTMVPLRTIFESLGASVEWDQSTRTVTSKKNDTTIVLTIDNPIMYVNSRQVVLETPACIIDERTLVPVRAISEAYGTNVEWDNSTRTVIITTGNAAVSYDDITLNVNQIKYFMDNGMYLEAMQSCETVKSQYNLSPADIALINSMYSEAQAQYNSYLEGQNTKECYPNTDIPTYTSVTGFQPIRQDPGDNEVITHFYKYDEASFLKYIEYLLNEGWVEYDREVDEANYTLTEYLVKNLEMVGVCAVIKYDEVWIMYKESN